MLFRRCNALKAIAALAAATLWPTLAGAARRPVSVETMPCHGAPTPYRLLVTTQGVRTNHGYVVLNLYGADKRRWLADKGWLNVVRDPAIPGDQTICLYLPTPGLYAVVMFQDSNANGDLDLGPLGPKEGYGFSNNVRPFLSAPSLDSALFPVSAGDTRLSIRLRYPPIS
ncbi:MAG TPA: DUF2141 domain-containing protein [Caulobacteraceae bacterium]|jgi:uncharacterized protein (DUF2141 family)|nr:DUF2141 domain-containing protein [Caulobacteraceae bacterium]